MDLAISAERSSRKPSLKQGIDPILSGFDMPLPIDVPITEEEVSGMEVILLTPCDNDHYSRVTCGKLAEKTKKFHGIHYVVGLLEEEQGIHSIGRDIGEQGRL